MTVWFWNNPSETGPRCVAPLAAWCSCQSPGELGRPNSPVSGKASCLHASFMSRSDGRKQDWGKSMENHTSAKKKTNSRWDSSSGRVWIEDSNFQELGCHRMHSAFLRRKSLLVWSFGVSGCLRFLNIPRGHTMDVEIIYQSIGVYHDVTFCGPSRSKDVHTWAWFKTREV